MSMLSDDLQRRAANIAKQSDDGRGVAISFDTVQAILDDYRSYVPLDTVELFTAACAVREPPTHVILKPSAFLRMTDAICQKHATERTAEAADYTDVP